MTALRLGGLSKSFPRQGEVLRGVSLQVKAGERFVLLGPSGSGKTTLLRLIAGLETPGGGEAQLGGTSLRGVPAERRGCGVVFQEPLLFPHLSVGENVAFGLRSPMSRVARKNAVREALEQVGLAGFEERRPQQLSGGQAQRVSLARALVTRPRLLLLDEPFSALDAPLRRELRAWLVELLERTQTTTLFVTHDQEEAVAVAQRLGLLLSGRLVQVGQPADFYARPASLAVARFFGGVNFLEGEQRGHLVHTALGVFQVPLAREGKVILSLRPEAFSLATGEEINRLDAVVTNTEFAGTHQRVTLISNEAPLVWHAPPHLSLARGECLSLRCPVSACWSIPREEP